MNKKFVLAQTEIVWFESESVIVTSGLVNNDNAIIGEPDEFGILD